MVKLAYVNVDQITVHEIKHVCFVVKETVASRCKHCARPWLQLRSLWVPVIVCACHDIVRQSRPEEFHYTSPACSSMQQVTYFSITVGTAPCTRAEPGENAGIWIAVSYTSGTGTNSGYLCVLASCSIHNFNGVTRGADIQQGPRPEATTIIILAHVKYRIPFANVRSPRMIQ